MVIGVKSTIELGRESAELLLTQFKNELFTSEYGHLSNEQLEDTLEFIDDLLAYNGESYNNYRIV